MQQARTFNSAPRDTGAIRRKLTLGVLLAGAFALAACESRQERQESFDGFYFKTKTVTVDRKETLAVFAATVSGVSQSLEGARQAGGYEGTKYCIEYYGSSKIDWVVGPQTPVENLTIVDDQLTFSGRCDP